MAAEGQGHSDPAAVSAAQWKGPRTRPCGFVSCAECCSRRPPSAVFTRAPRSIYNKVYIVVIFKPLLDES